MGQESEAERSLRELQEGMAQRDQAREASVGRRPERSSTARPTASAVTKVGGSRRWSVVAGVVVVLLVLGVVGAVMGRIPGLTGGGEGADAGSSSYYDADFATTYEEANAGQAERGREATASAEELDIPAEWVQDNGETELTMRDDGDNTSAIYGTYFRAPADYTAADFTAWFQGNEAVTSSDPADVSCDAVDGDRQLSCEVVLASGGIGDDTEGPRLSVSAAYFASTGPGDQASVLVTGYSMMV